MTACRSCGGDGFKKPLEPLKGIPGAVKRCPDCRDGTERKGVSRLSETWWSVKFKTVEDDVIRISLKAKDSDEAAVKARELLRADLYVTLLEI